MPTVVRDSPLALMIGVASKCLGLISFTPGQQQAVPEASSPVHDGSELHKLIIGCCRQAMLLLMVLQHLAPIKACVSRHAQQCQASSGS